MGQQRGHSPWPWHQVRSDPMQRERSAKPPREAQGRLPSAYKPALVAATPLTVETANNNDYLLGLTQSLRASGLSFTSVRYGRPGIAADASRRPASPFPRWPSFCGLSFAYLYLLGNMRYRRRFGPPYP